MQQTDSPLSFLETTQKCQTYRNYQVQFATEVMQQWHARQRIANKSEKSHHQDSLLSTSGTVCGWKKTVALKTVFQNYFGQCDTQMIAYWYHIALAVQDADQFMDTLGNCLTEQKSEWPCTLWQEFYDIVHNEEDSIESSHDLKSILNSFEKTTTALESISDHEPIALLQSQADTIQDMITLAFLYYIPETAKDCRAAVDAIHWRYTIYYEQRLKYLSHSNMTEPIPTLKRIVSLAHSLVQTLARSILSVNDSSHSDALDEATFVLNTFAQRQATLVPSTALQTPNKATIECVKDENKQSFKELITLWLRGDTSHRQSAKEVLLYVPWTFDITPMRMMSALLTGCLSPGDDLEDHVVDTVIQFIKIHGGYLKQAGYRETLEQMIQVYLVGKVWQPIRELFLLEWQQEPKMEFKANLSKSLSSEMLLGYSAEQVAQMWSFLLSERFKLLSLAEFASRDCIARHMDGQWICKGNSLVAYQSVLQNLCKSLMEMLLNEKSIRMRADLLQHIIHIAEHALFMNNYVLCHVLAATVTHKTMAAALEQTWNFVQRRERLAMERIVTLTKAGQGSQYVEYRKTVRRIQPPSLPILNVVLNDIYSIFQQRTEDWSHEQRRLMVAVLRRVHSWQTQSYPEIEEAMDLWGWLFADTPKKEDFIILSDEYHLNPNSLAI